MRIAINGKNAALAWQDRARQLNEETDRLLKEVSSTLQSVRQFSEGTLVDEIVDLGDKLVTATTKLMQGMNGIFDVVNSLLNFLENLITGSSQDVKSTASYV